MVEDAENLLALEKIEINGRIIKLVPYEEKKKRGTKDARDFSSNLNIPDRNESSDPSTD